MESEAREFVEAITIEKSRYCDPGYEGCTISAGIFIPWMYEAVWHKQPSFVTELFCQVRARIGKIVGNFERRAPDTWWFPRSEEEYAAACDEMGRLMVSHVLPFLASFKTMEDVHSFLNRELKYLLRDPLSTINLALVKKALGDVQGAREVLNACLKRRAGGWSDRVNEALARCVDEEEAGPAGQ